MKRLKQRWYLITIVLVTLVVPTIAVAPFKKVAIVTSTTALTTTSSTLSTEALPTVDAEETKSDNITSTGPTKNSKLTGIPQIDYIWDPNLPRELRGYNLSSYPFFSSVPPEEDIHFKCDGLHDGFYASIEHKCQLYHHCVYGIRHDFLCANFTAFDQKTFICHFVSDVDCEGSQKYWNRNDALYMATTTTSTTTTTTEPPPTPRRRLVRPQRPLRRPTHRRPDDDYYYDEEEYDEDYFEERVNSRRKQRPRNRKPQLDYDDEHEEKRALNDDEKPRRYNSRDRIRDSEAELEDDYENERPKIERSKARKKSQLPAERRKTGARRPITVSGRSSPDERRAFNAYEKPSTRKDKGRQNTTQSPLSPSRNIGNGRRRLNEKRPTQTVAPTSDVEDNDYDEKSHTSVDDGETSHEPEVDEIIDDGSDMQSKAKDKPKLLEEFVTPKAPGASVYARPRAPPRIPRPVPVNARKKFEYPVQKSTATTVAPAEYEEYDDYADPLPRPRPSNGRRRAEGDTVDTQSSSRRQKPNRHTLRKPITDKKSYLADEDEYEVSNERFEGRLTNGRKRPYNHHRPRLPVRGDGGDLDFVDDEYDEAAVATPPPPRKIHRLRSKNLSRKNAAAILRPQAAVDYADEETYEAEPEVEVRKRLYENNAGGRPRTAVNVKQRHIKAASTESSAHYDHNEAVDDDVSESAAPSSKSNLPTERPARPTAVRVVKRPFLPSRGGSPYLPRGLQPVGIAHRTIVGMGGISQTTDNTPIDMGSTISGVHLLEHGAPILRDSGREHNSYNSDLPLSTPRTNFMLPVQSQAQGEFQQQQQHQPNKATLDELYETDYDVTLNDALNPTLKPLSPLPNHHQFHHQHLHQQLSNQNYASAYASSNSKSASDPLFVSNHTNNKSTSIQYHNVQGSNSNNHNNNDNEERNSSYQQHPIAYQTLSPSHSQSQSSPSQMQSQSMHNQNQPNHHNHQYQTDLNNFNSDSYFSSTDIRRRAVVIPTSKGHSSHTSAQQYRGVGTRIAQHFYDDFDY